MAAMRFEKVQESHYIKGDEGATLEISSIPDHWQSPKERAFSLATLPQYIYI